MGTPGRQIAGVPRTQEGMALLAEILSDIRHHRRNDPASAPTLPGHDPNHSCKEKAMGTRSATTAPAVQAIGDSEHKAWTDLDDKISACRNRLDVAYHFAAELADAEANGFNVTVHYDNLQRFCFMVFESFDTMKEVEALAGAYYRADIAPREAA